MAVSITLLYVILVLCTCAIVAVGLAIFLRWRRLSRISRTQFMRAVGESPADKGSAVNPANYSE